MVVLEISSEGGKRMTGVRQPAVAGRFYPADPDELRDTIRKFLAPVRSDGPSPKAIIAPHAGYVYSGPIAASAYARLASGRDTIERVVMFGPAHRVLVNGSVLPQATTFLTPLGAVPLDTETIDLVSQLPQVHLSDEAHEWEHCLEVHLPFLQESLGSFRLIPFLVGQIEDEQLRELLEAVWGGPETLIVVSSDLSHYKSYQEARDFDAATSRLIESMCHQELRPDQACGCRPIQALMQVAGRRGLRASVVDLRNSGDTAGPRDQVVGYGAYVFA